MRQANQFLKFGGDRMTRQKGLLFALMIIVLLTLCGCDVIKPADDLKPDVTAAVIIKPVVIEAAATATPEPVVVKRDPVKSHGPMRILQDVPENKVNEIPSFYQPIDLDGVNHCVYAFTTADGTTEFRVYAEVDELEDQNVMNTLVGFFKAEITKSERGYFIQTNKDDNPINLSTEKPTKYTPCNAPTKANIQAFVREMESAAQKYQREYNKAEKNGEPLPEPTPWNGLPIYTKETEPVQIPNQVRPIRNSIGLYYYVDNYGDEVFRRYATSNGINSGFYRSNNEGDIIPGSLKIDISRDFVQANFKQRKLDEKPEDNTYRLPVIVLLSSGEQETVWTVYQKEIPQT